MGYTCDHGTLHLNEDIVYVQKEYLDKRKGKFVPIITDFRRKTQPIIRYRLGDILTERKDPCPCGSVLTALESIEGREEDMFLLSTLDGNICKVFPDTLHQALLHTGTVLEHYQLRQLTLSHIKVLLAPFSLDVRERVERALTTLWQTLRLQPVSLTFEPFIFNVSSKKMKRVENLLHKTDANSLKADSEENYTGVI